MEKESVISNGKEMSGKDTFCKFTSLKYNVHNYSANKPIFKAAEVGGWRGEKIAEGRKLLSDLKKVFTEYNNLSLNYLLIKYMIFFE